MRRLRFLSGARSDLAQIYAYIEDTSGGGAAAERFARQLIDQCRRLASLPGALGRPRPELAPDLRGFPFKGYVIFFRYVDGETLEVVNVVEGHRDIETLYGESDG